MLSSVRRTASEWGTAEMFMDANVVRTFLNDGREHGAASEQEYGQFALYPGGTIEVRFRNVEYKDFAAKYRESDRPSPNFCKQALAEFFYSHSVGPLGGYEMCNH
jgi:hypothetical protein